MSLQLSFASADQAVSVRPIQYAEGEQWSASENMLLRVEASTDGRENLSAPAAGSDVLDRLGKALSLPRDLPGISWSPAPRMRSGWRS